MPAAGQPEGASLGIRFAARLIDGIIVGVVAIVIGFAMPDSIIVSGIVGAALAMGYYVFFETSQGATPAKSMLGLEVVAEGGGHPDVMASATRNAFNAFQVVPILGSFAALGAVIAIAVTIGSDPGNRGLHDKMSSTTVRKKA